MQLSSHAVEEPMETSKSLHTIIRYFAFFVSHLITVSLSLFQNNTEHWYVIIYVSLRDKEV